MSTPCFLCLSNTRNRVCHQCRLKGHRKCWKKYVERSSEIEMNTGSSQVTCPQCKIHIRKRGGVTTRSMAMKSDKKIIVSKIKKLLEQVDRSNGRVNKERYAREIFNYLLKNKWFLKTHYILEKAVRNKLIEFQTKDHWDYAGDMYMKMFGEQIPTERI